MPRESGVNLVNDQRRAVALRDELMPMNPVTEWTAKLHIGETRFVHLNNASDPADRDDAKPKAKRHFIARLQRARCRKQFHPHGKRSEGDKVVRIAMERCHDGNGRTNSESMSELHHRVRFMAASRSQQASQKPEKACRMPTMPNAVSAARAAKGKRGMPKPAAIISAPLMPRSHLCVGVMLGFSRTV
jgi:hypothetical protein